MDKIDLNPQEITTAMEIMASICPFRDRDEFLHEDFTLDANGKSSGWFFECRLCSGAKCTGYLRNPRKK